MRATIDPLDLLIWNAYKEHKLVCSLFVYKYKYKYAFGVFLFHERQIKMIINENERACDIKNISVFSVHYLDMVIYEALMS